MKPLFLFMIFTGSSILLTGNTAMAQVPATPRHLDSTVSQPKKAHAYPPPLPAAPPMEGIPKPQGLKAPTSISMPPATPKPAIAPKADLVAEDSTITPPPLPAAGKETPKPAPVTSPKSKHKKHNMPHATA